jgi:hypothetical protein
VRLVCSGWKCHHDALVMRLSLRQDATDSTAESVGWVLTRAVMVASPPQLMDTEPLSPCTAVHLQLGF